MPDAAVRAPGPWTLRRPRGLVARTRWLFGLMCVLSLLLCLPLAVLGADGTGLLLLAGACAALALSWAPRRGRRPVVLDVLEALGMAAFTLGSAEPTTVFGIAFPVLWLRAAGRSTRRGLLQCTGLAAGIGSAVLLWELVPGRGVVDATSLLGVLPLMLVTFAGARYLARGMVDREAAMARDTALVELGTQLLGVTDAEQVLAAGRAAVRAVCTATPGLRVLTVAVPEGRVRVLRAVGEWRRVPEELPAEVVDDSDPGAEVRIVEVAGAAAALLDAAAGRRCGWACASSPESSELRLLVGAPGGLPEEVVVSVRSLVNQVALALRNSRVHAQLSTQARTDALTGLANRARFLEELAGAAAAPGELAVLFLDLDDFKAVNDGAGHAAGDEVLCGVAEVLRAQARPQDLCARLGGDEFAVLLRGLDAAGALAVGQRLVSALSSPGPGGRAGPGASVGAVHAATPQEPGLLLHRADVAMYAAKAAGKGGVRLFHEDLLPVPRLPAPRPAAGSRV